MPHPQQPSSTCSPLLIQPVPAAAAAAAFEARCYRPVKGLHKVNAGVQSPRDMSLDAKCKGGVTWLHAWEDPVANLPITSARMCLADVTGAGEVDLLAVDNANRIRVYRGTSLVSETLLLGSPAAIAPVYLDDKHPCVPAVAVAIGPTLYIYKKLRPFRKSAALRCVRLCVYRARRDAACRFLVPVTPAHAEEANAWADLASAALSLDQAQKALSECR